MLLFQLIYRRSKFSYKTKTVRYFIILLFCLLWVCNIQGQITTSRITILKGTFPYFAVNSLLKIENGISYTDFTHLRIYFLNTDIFGTPNADTTWHLKVIALRDSIYGDAGHSMPLDRIEIRINSAPSGCTYNSSTWYPLSYGTYTVLVYDGPNSTINGEIGIDYRVGSPPNNFWGVATDYYAVDLEFVLEKQP